MLDDALWTSLYSDEQIRLIEEHEHLDPEVQKAIDTILGLLDIVD